MKIIKIDKKDWAGGLEKVSEQYKVFGPVKDGDAHDFKKLDKGRLPDLDLGNTRLSPKSVVYPQSEVMFEFSLNKKDEDHHIMKEAAADYSPRAIFGVRPCDAASFRLVQRNFDTPQYKDPYWINSYNACTFIGLACDDPAGICFCTSTDGSPYGETGLDVLLIDDGDSYLAKLLTSKGEFLFKTAGWSADAGAIATSQIADKKAAAEAKISSTVEFDKIKKAKAVDLFEAPFWEETAFSCLNCGTCTYSCPTCWCFDIQDEVKGDSGVRMRNWDACMYSLFTLEASGHNPRSKKSQRVRQRFMHKLKYYADKYDDGILCVGCGRCIGLCPVNIDIRSVSRTMNSYQSA